MPEVVAENAQIKEAALTLQLSSYLPNQGVNRRGMLINQLQLRILPQSCYVQQLTQPSPIQVKSKRKRFDIVILAILFANGYVYRILNKSRLFGVLRYFKIQLLFTTSTRFYY
jgi:hypothetical protein